MAPINKKNPKAAGFDPSKFSAASIAGGTRKAAEPPAETLVDNDEASLASESLILDNTLEQASRVRRDRINEMVSNEHESAGRVREREVRVDQGLVSTDEILSSVADKLGMETIDLAQITVTRELLSLIPSKFAKKHHVFPCEATDDEIKVAVSDPNNVAPIDDLRMLLGRTIVPVLASEVDVERMIQRYYESEEIGQVYESYTRDTSDGYDKALAKYENLDLDEEGANQPPVVRFVSLLFKQAVHDGASDIHVEPQRRGLVIRFRIDGVLQELPMPPRRWQNAILSRLKVLSGMDLAERRIPQDGRIKLTLPGKVLDLRVSCLPSIFGETIVMRILDQSDVSRGLEDVGFLPDSIQKFERLIRQPNGIILMTGPTGSGKTTTLNSALSTLNRPETKIITVENPVEYQIQGINQIQVDEEVELDFAVALRSMLRMSPDIIMVGEIRDLETAEIAIRAALTGHLVFSTLHTNDAPSATVRLIEMGIKPFLVASSIQAVIAQRLIRRICSNCKREHPMPPGVMVEMGVDPKDYVDTIFFQGTGCERCSNSGYKGRTAIHEIFIMNPELRKLVIQSESNLRIKRKAVEMGMRTLRQDGWEKVCLGQTTAEEVMRITQMD